MADKPEGSISQTVPTATPGTDAAQSPTSLNKVAKPPPLPLKPAGLVPSLNLPKGHGAGMPTMKLPPPLPGQPKQPATGLPTPASRSGVTMRLPVPQTPAVRRKIAKEELYKEIDTSKPSLKAQEPAGWKALEPGELGEVSVDLFSPPAFERLAESPQRPNAPSSEAKPTSPSILPSTPVPLSTDIKSAPPIAPPLSPAPERKTPSQATTDLKSVEEGAKENKIGPAFVARLQNLTQRKLRVAPTTSPLSKEPALPQKTPNPSAVTPESGRKPEALVSPAKPAANLSLAAPPSSPSLIKPIPLALNKATPVLPEAQKVPNLPLPDLKSQPTPSTPQPVSIAKETKTPTEQPLPVVLKDTPKDTPKTPEPLVVPASKPAGLPSDEPTLKIPALKPLSPIALKDNKLSPTGLPAELIPPSAKDFKFPDKKPGALFSRRPKPSLEELKKNTPPNQIEKKIEIKSVVTPAEIQKKIATPQPTEEDLTPMSGAKLVRTTLRRVSKTAAKKTAVEAPVVAPVKKVKKAAEPVTREQRQKRWQWFYFVIFYVVLAGVLSALYFFAPFYLQETRLEGQIIPPSGLALSNEVWVVSDFSETARADADDLMLRRGPKLEEIASQEDRYARVKADATVKKDRIKTLQEQVDSYHQQITTVIQEAKVAAQAIWDGPGAQLDKDYDAQLAVVKNTIADRAKALHLNYKPNPDYNDFDVWASAYRLALYEVPPGVDSVKEHKWLQDQQTAWRAFTKSLDDKSKALRDQAAQIKASPTDKVADLNEQINEVQRKIDVTTDELQPILKEIQDCETALAQLHAEDATFDPEAYRELYALPGESSNNDPKFRFPVESNGRFSWRHVETNFEPTQKLRRFWLFTRATRKSDGLEYWALINVEVIRNRPTLITIEPSAFLNTKLILHPELSAENASNANP